MTEYDYSPEAYERYIAKQAAIARWVNDTNHCAPANPFIPSEAPGSPYLEQTRRSIPRNAHDSESDEDQYYNSSSHHRHLRQDDRDCQKRPSYSRYDSRQSHSSSSKHSRSRSSSSRSRSNSYYVPHGQSSHHQDRAGYFSSSPYTPNPYYASSPNTPLSSPPPPPPQPRTPYEANQPRVVPINGGAGGYYLVPPQGISYQLVQPQSPSPTQPWLKRVFSPTSNVAESPSRSARPGGGRRSERRSGKWSWDIY